MSEVSSNSVLESTAWKDVALLLLGAAADHAVHCGSADVEPYRKHLRESIETLQHATESSQILMNAGGAVQAFAQYADKTQEQVEALVTEVNDTAQIFLTHLEKLHGDADTQSILADLRSTMEKALDEANLKTAREAALASLEQLAQHAAAKRTQTLELTGNLQDRFTVLEQSVTPGGTRALATPPTVDSTTGLPKRSDAEAAMQRTLESASETGPRSYAAIFYLHRMALTNARFGEAIGNQVMLFCSQHLATTVTRATDSLFRWSGPAFVAIIERPESELAVNTEIQRLISSPLSRFFETSSRSVYLPVRVTAEVIPLYETTFAEVTDKVEHFVLTTSGQGQSN